MSIFALVRSAEELRKTTSILLLVFYVASFTGYGVFTIAHDIAHYVPNIFHHHHHHGHHHVEDHSETLEKLKTTDKETGTMSPLKIIYLLNSLAEESKILFYNATIHDIIRIWDDYLIETHQNPPPTPPPLESGYYTALRNVNHIIALF